MFFKKIIQKNIKLLAVLGVVVSVFGFYTATSEAKQDMDLQTLNSTGSRWEKQSSTDTWNKEGGGFLGSNIKFDTSQADKGMTYDASRATSILSASNENLVYSEGSTGVEAGARGLYYIGTGKLDASGNQVTAVYDKGIDNYNPLDDRLREIRVQKPDGTSFVYIWTGGDAIVKEGSGLKGKVNDKEVLDELGQKIGVSNLYNEIVQEDIESKYSGVLASAKAAVDDGTITQADADKLRNAILNEKNLTAVEKSEIQPIINKINARLQNNGRSNDDLLTVGEGEVVRTVAQNNIVTSNVATAAEASGRANKESNGDFSDGRLEHCIDSRYGTFFFEVNLGACFAEALYFLLSILAFLLGIVGGFFNLIFDVTLVNMKENVEKITIVSAGWATIRDFANILFIFMLLYLAISTILQLDDHGVKHGLSRLIVGAVLINFSLFFVKIPIDISNILAIEIYDKIKVTGHSAVENDGSVGISFGLGDAILSMFSPQQVFENSSLDPKTVTAGALSGKSSKEIGWNLKKNPITTFAMGIIVMFTSMLVFLAVCIIFIKRFITLVMLMIFSPLAFAGMAVPNHDIEHQISSKFWSSLLKESFYAPVFMFMMYLTIKTGTAINTVGLKGSEGFWANLTTVPVTNVISYAVVIGMMIFSLTVSETMGVKGASGAIKFFDGARGAATGWVATNTIGRIAHTTLNKGKSASYLTDKATNGNFITKNLARGTQGVLKNVGKGFGEKVHADEEYKKAHDEEMHNDPNVRAKMMIRHINDDGTVNTLSSGLQATDIIAHHYNAEENANVKLSLEKMKKEATATIADKSKSAKEIKEAQVTLNKTEGALARYYTGDHAKNIHARLTPEMANKVARAEFGELDHYNDEFREILNGDKEKMGDKIKEFVQNAKSEAAVIGALKSAGTAMDVMKMKDPTDPKNKAWNDEVKIIKASLSSALRDKFNGEAAYASIAKDPIIDKEVRAAISAGGYYAKMTADIYDTLTNDNKKDPADSHTIGEVAKGKKEITDKFIELLKKINNDEIKAAVASGNIDNMIAKYKELKLGDDRPTQNFFSKDNALRSQTQSNEVVTELEYLANNGVKGMYANK